MLIKNLLAINNYHILVLTFEGMTRKERDKLPDEGKVITIFLYGDALEIVAERKKSYFEKTKKNLAWDRAVIKSIEGK